MSHKPFASYTYVVIGRERILETKTIMPNFGQSQTEYVDRFSFTPDFRFAPRARLIVYFVRNSFIVSSTEYIDLKDDFKNHIEVGIGTDTAKPGQMVDINVKSNPNAYIGLLGIDKSVLLLRSGNDLDRESIWQELECFYTQLHKPGRMRKRVQTYYNPRADFSVILIIMQSNCSLTIIFNHLEPDIVHQSWRTQRSNVCLLLWDEKYEENGWRWSYFRWRVFSAGTGIECGAYDRKLCDRWTTQSSKRVSRNLDLGFDGLQGVINNRYFITNWIN